ncbi:MAG: recombinase family protein, partial [Phenylobacterium sp.]
TTTAVRTLLANEVYCGTAVLGKDIFNLNHWVGHAPRSTWRRRLNTVPAIVSAATWGKAQVFLVAGGNRFVSQAVLLADLHRLRAKHDHLSAEIIGASDGYPVGVYRRVFGSLTAAYLEAGLGKSLADCRARLRAARPIESYRRNAAASDEALLENLRAVYRREGRLSSWIIDHAPDCPTVAVYRIHFGGLRRAYALAGYQPSPYQDLQMAARGQPYSPADALWICGLVRGAASAEEIRAADAEALARGRSA